MKLELFTIFDKFRPRPGLFFASNTSSSSIADFTDVTVFTRPLRGHAFLQSRAGK